MEPQLTICVPTYNRAAELEQQLAVVLAEVTGLADRVEVIVSDNCSADDTPSVVARWQDRFGDVPFRAQRHPENIGWMRNFLSCYRLARGRYTWIIGDDDTVYPGTLKFVLDALDADPALALMYLNFLGRSAETGEVHMDHWFEPMLADWDRADGRAIYQHSIEHHFGSVIFVTSAVIRTDLALAGVERWPECVGNWGGMAFWCGYAALQGNTYVTRENHVECLLGQSYWQKDPLAWFGIRHREIPEVYLHLSRIGFQRSFCFRKILKILQEDIASKEGPKNLREYAQALRQRPRWALGVIGFYLSALLRVAVGR